MKLKELYERETDVSECEIPNRWKESFNKFMFGQTCLMEDGKFVYYYHDFRIWYHINQTQIERDEKIDSVIDKKSPLI